MSGNKVQEGTEMVRSVQSPSPSVMSREDDHEGSCLSSGALSKAQVLSAKEVKCSSSSIHHTRTSNIGYAQRDTFAEEKYFVYTCAERDSWESSLSEVFQNFCS